MRDPAASLALFPIDFELAGRTFTLPPVPCGRWVQLLLANDLIALVTPEPDGVIDDEQARVIEELLIEGEVTMTALREALQDVVSVAAGRDWWEGVGLIHTIAAEANWGRLHGQIVAAGVDPASAPLGAWLDVGMHVATQHMDEKQLLRFVGILQTPPAEVGIDEERESAAFLAMLGG